MEFVFTKRNFNISCVTLSKSELKRGWKEVKSSYCACKIMCFFSLRHARSTTLNCRKLHIFSLFAYWMVSVMLLFPYFLFAPVSSDLFLPLYYSLDLSSILCRHIISFFSLHFFVFVFPFSLNFNETE